MTINSKPCYHCRVNVTLVTFGPFWNGIPKDAVVSHRLEAKIKWDMELHEENQMCPTHRYPKGIKNKKFLYVYLCEDCRKPIKDVKDEEEIHLRCDTCERERKRS